MAETEEQHAAASDDAAADAEPKVKKAKGKPELAYELNYMSGIFRKFKELAGEDKKEMSKEARHLLNDMVVALIVTTAKTASIFSSNAGLIQVRDHVVPCTIDHLLGLHTPYGKRCLAAVVKCGAALSTTMLEKKEKKAAVAAAATGTEGSGDKEKKKKKDKTAKKAKEADGPPAIRGKKAKDAAPAASEPKAASKKRKEPPLPAEPEENEADAEPPKPAKRARKQ